MLATLFGSAPVRAPTAFDAYQGPHSFRPALAALHTTEIAAIHG